MILHARIIFVMFIKLLNFFKYYKLHIQFRFIQTKNQVVFNKAIKDFKANFLAE